MPKLLFSIGLTVILLKLPPHLQWFNQAWYKCGQHFTGTSCAQNFDMHFESTHSIDWVLRWGFEKKAVTLTTMKISIPMQKSKMTVLAQLSVMSLVMHLNQHIPLNDCWDINSPAKKLTHYRLPYWQSWRLWILNHQNPMTGYWFEFLQEKGLKNCKINNHQGCHLDDHYKWNYHYHDIQLESLNSVAKFMKEGFSDNKCHPDSH